jgi:hypothetical protein
MYAINKASPKRDIIEALRKEGFDAPDADATRDELLALLSQLTGDDYSKMSPTPKKVAEKAAADAPEAEKKYTIVIPSGDTAANQGDVFVQFNGRAFQIQRDVEVEVPECVINVLRKAQTTIGRQKGDGSVEYRKVPTYPFNVVN